MSIDPKLDVRDAQKLSNSIYLRAIDPTVNKARFYSLHIMEDLWGGVSLVREHGRIGRPGKVILNWYPKINDAITAMHTIHRKKLKRGYQ